MADGSLMLLWLGIIFHERLSQVEVPVVRWLLVGRGCSYRIMLLEQYSVILMDS